MSLISATPFKINNMELKNRNAFSIYNDFYYTI